MAWTDDKKDTLTRMWGEGKVCSEIGAAVGVSSSAVAGMVRRLGLPARGNPVQRKEAREASLQRVFDRVIDAPLNHPVTIAEAATAENIFPAVAEQRWKETIERTHGGDPQ